VDRLSLAEKVRRRKAEGMRNRDIAARYGISNRRVGRILWEASHKAHRQAYETEWKRNRYIDNEAYRERRIDASRRYRTRIRQEATP
jgi:transposase